MRTERGGQDPARLFIGEVSVTPYGTTDADWVLLEPEFAGFRYADECSRLLFDAALFYLRTDAMLTKLPLPFGSRSSVFNGIKAMVNRGYLARGIAALERECSPAVAGLDTAKLSRYMPIEGQSAA